MKILVIEDDKFFQKFYSAKLKEAGYEIDVAENGKIGLEKIKTFKPSLILLDIIMPTMDGFEVLEKMGKDSEMKSIPVLVFSTLGQDDDVKKAKALGARDFVNKSYFDLDKLKSKISSIVK